MSLGLTELALRRRQAQKSGVIEYGTRDGRAATDQDSLQPDNTRVWAVPSRNASKTRSSPTVRLPTVCTVAPR